MKKKQLKKLVEYSYNKENLNETNTQAIANLLSRKDLKQYINALKAHENKSTVTISIPSEPSAEIISLFKKTYKNKQVLFDIDPSLLLGVRIVENDMVYNGSLQKRLEDLSEKIETI